MKCVKNPRISISIKELQASSKEKGATYFNENIFFCLQNLRQQKISTLQLISSSIHKEKGYNQRYVWGTEWERDSCIVPDVVQMH